VVRSCHKAAMPYDKWNKLVSKASLSSRKGKAAKGIRRLSKTFTCHCHASAQEAAGCMHAHRQLPIAEMSQEREWLAGFGERQYSSRASLDLLGWMLSTKGAE
jgi:hypothetical protein